MAEGSVETVGVMAKLTSATTGGALWGIFATSFLLIPAVFGTIFAPLFKKTKDVVDEKVNGIQTKTKAEPVKVKASKTARDYESKKQRLEDDHRLAQLQEEIQRLNAKRTRRPSARNSTSATTV